MPFNPQGGVELPLDVFGGLVTEVTPTDLQRGSSPDLQDVAFSPGSVFTRAGLQRASGDPFPAGGPFGKVPGVNYGKSYVDKKKTIRNLYLDTNGGLWLQPSVGSNTKLTDTTPFSRAKSTTAFGREFIAISDGYIGTDIPLQYDGTNLDRVTQDGPGAPPAVSSFKLAASQMNPTGAPPVLAVTECDPSGDSGAGYFTTINVFVTGHIAGIAFPGNQVTIAGNSQALFNGVFSIVSVFDGANSLIILSAITPSGTTFGLGGTATIGSGITMSRQGNIVTVNTLQPHSLQVGYRAQISLMTAAPIGASISSIAINNEDAPGVATVTTSSPHGLVPGLQVSISGVNSAVVGTGNVQAVRAGQIVTVETTDPHGLTPGAVVTLNATTETSLNTTLVVQQVISPTKYVCYQAGADATGTGGNTQLNWPIPDTATPTYFEVLSAPDATSFQISVNYTDGAWAGGNVTYAWDGTFFVSAVLSANAFQYKQYGPDAVTTQVGLVTPYGQAAPGIHQMQVMFLTRQGYLTRPSPPVSFVANGGQYISASNIPIGPPNVVARVLAFTGTDGAYFFYIGAPAVVNGQVVSTTTQINDNTTTSAVLDFSDNTLYAATAINIPGNNLAAQIILDGALGFGFYGDRLITYGQRNTIQNLLNMGFDGGAFPSAPTLPTGWQAQDTHGAIGNGHFGKGWIITAPSSAGVVALGGLTQSMYRDAYGAPIATPLTKYRIRAWLKASNVPSDAYFEAKIFSTSLGFTAFATITAPSISTSGEWIEQSFGAALPSQIPSDMALEFYIISPTQAMTVTVDEMSLIYDDRPYLDTVLYGSYIDNPEAFDGVTGKFGALDDTRKAMDLGIVRTSLYLVTQDPSGRVHRITNNGVTEPSGWSVDEVCANCGTLSAFAMTVSQLDDGTASGGPEWIAWASLAGWRIFNGDQPWLISEEIDPDWKTINPNGYLGIWATNDPYNRAMYVGLPTQASAPVPAPDKVYTLDYKNLDGAYQIAQASPLSFPGSDRVRKWSRWSLKINGGALLYHGGSPSMTLMGGNGVASGENCGGFGCAYTLDPAALSDQDYGQIQSYYTTYFFVPPEEEAATRLGSHMKMLTYLTAIVSGVGNFTITPLINKLTNPWAQVCQRTLAVDPTYDLEWTGSSATGQRIAFKIQSTPIAPSIDSAFNLNRIVPSFRGNVHLPVRGAA